MYFTARMLYFSVITVVFWLPVTDWSVCTLGDWDVVFLSTLKFTSNVCCVRLDSNQRYSLQDLCSYRLDETHP